MKSVTTYLSDGNCRQAMSFYQQCLGSELQLYAYPDAQGQPSSDPAARIKHSQLSHGGGTILGQHALGRALWHAHRQIRYPVDTQLQPAWVNTPNATRTFEGPAPENQARANRPHQHYRRADQPHHG